MHARPFVTKLILAAFVLAALFGIYGMVSLAHTEHGGCPAAAQHSLCATPLEHLGHWQAMFTAVFAEIIALFAFVVFFSTVATPPADTLRRISWQYKKRQPLRPTMLQELFSQGILHRKEPQIA